MGIPLSDDGADLAGAVYSLEVPDTPSAVGTSVRTGVSGPGGLEAYPWRFYIPHDATVSPYRASVPRKRD
jgi:DNA-3-methyladenine glycosylase